MTIICWGNLAKSADDTQRIEQAITDYVELHNENVNAHQLEGSALYMHRVNEKLDHLEGSVTARYFAKDHIFGLGVFESLDGWSTHGTITAGIFGALVRTGTVDPDDYCYLIPKALLGSNVVMDPSKNPIFQTTLMYHYDTSQTSYFGAGSFGLDEQYDGFGFKVSNGTLYACWSREAVISTYEITGINVDEVHCYRANIDSDLGEMYFYVDGILKHTVTTGLPLNTPSLLFSYHLIRTSATERTIYPIDWLFQQDR